MSQLKKTPFQFSILAAAVLSLSACTTSPKVAGIDLGSVGSGIGKVGSKTKELSASAWESTKEFLNIGPNSPELLDEVDLALMEEDADLDAVQLASVDGDLPLLPQSADGSTDPNVLLPRTSVPANADEQQLAFGEIPSSANTATDASGDIIVLASTDGPAVQPADDIIVASNEAMGTGNTIIANDADTETVATKDLIHEVGESETLWNIAKATTGDANNWHVIADINDLAPDAAVYPGQKIVIPADMLKEEQVSVVAEVDSSEGNALLKENVQPTVALNVPSKNADAVTAESVAAAADQIKPAASATPENLMADATALKVGTGETLWDFAKRTTGDATNWKLIAEKNLFTEQQAGMVVPGQKIYVPNDMVRYRDENGVLIAKGEEGSIPTATIGGVMPSDQTSIEATAAVLTGNNQPAEGEIKIVEAAYQDDSAIKPVTPETLSAEASEEMETTTGDLGKVMVSGTYYPKAVYHDADFSSGLLMRVSPGTQLIVSKAVGPWLEVQTDKGTGYVHSRDIK